MNSKLLIGVGAVVGVALVAAVALSVATETPADPSNAYGTVSVQGDPLPVLADPQSDLAPGLVAPTLTGTTPDGTTLTIGPDGRAKILVFLAHWCPHCQAEVPRLTEYLRQTGGDPAVDVYGIATSTSQARPNFPPTEWLAREGWPAPVILDDQQNTAGRAFGVASFPTWVIVDGSNRVLARLTGELGSEAFPGLFAFAASGAGGAPQQSGGSSPAG